MIDHNNVALREILEQRFSLNELRKLCDRLKIDDELLDRSAKDVLARDIIGPELSTHEFAFDLKTDEAITSIQPSVLVGGQDLGTVCLSSVEIAPR